MPLFFYRRRLASTQKTTEKAKRRMPKLRQHKWIAWVTSSRDSSQSPEKAAPRKQARKKSKQETTTTTGEDARRKKTIRPPSANNCAVSARLGPGHTQAISNNERNCGGAAAADCRRQEKQTTRRARTETGHGGARRATASARFHRSFLHSFVPAFSLPPSASPRPITEHEKEETRTHLSERAQGEYASEARGGRAESALSKKPPATANFSQPRGTPDRRPPPCVPSDRSRGCRRH